MSEEYKSLAELNQKVLECKIIDLVPHVAALSPALSGALKQSGCGLYLPNSIEPFFSSTGNYQLTHPNPCRDIVNIPFQDLVNDVHGISKLPEGNIRKVDSDVVLKRWFYEKMKRHLSLESDVLKLGCEAAIATVLSYLNTLCPKYNCIRVRQYDLNQIVKDEYRHLLDQEKFEDAFEPLYREVADFVKRDTWNVYYYKVLGTTLILEKGMDYRIIDWYTARIKASELYDHDLGGIASVQYNQ